MARLYRDCTIWFKVIAGCLLRRDRLVDGLQPVDSSASALHRVDSPPCSFSHRYSFSRCRLTVASTMPRDLYAPIQAQQWPPRARARAPKPSVRIKRIFYKSHLQNARAVSINLLDAAQPRTTKKRNSRRCAFAGANRPVQYATSSLT